MSRSTGRIQSAFYRLAFLGGGAAFTYVYLEEFISPFIPLIVTIAGSLIAGLLVRFIFICLFNRKLNVAYRYTNPQTNTRNNTQTTTQTQSQHNRVYKTQGRTASRGSANTPPDSLSLYRNLLGLGPHFTGEELKAAYHNAAAMYHPDRYASSTKRDRENAEDLMKKVNEAYQCLKTAAM